jgi:hypothetical protein
MKTSTTGHNDNISQESSKIKIPITETIRESKNKELNISKIQIKYK